MKILTTKILINMDCKKVISCTKIEHDVMKFTTALKIDFIMHSPVHIQLERKLINNVNFNVFLGHS